jgi:hypothetical protein
MVKHVYSGGAQQLQDSIKLSDTSLALGAGTVQLIFKGILASGGTSVDWDGTNDNGQLVSPGSYFFKVESHDAFGKIMSVSAAVTALPGTGQNSLQVFNTAGEVVATIYPSQYLPPKATVEDFFLDRTSFAAAFNPVTGAPLSHLNVTLKDNLGNFYTAQWDGKNSQGRPVASGVYVIQLLSSKGGGQTLLSRQVDVLATKIEYPADKVFVAPNPLKPEAGQTAEVDVYYMPLAIGGRARARVYDVAGQMVGQVEDASNTGILRIDGGAWASGIYFIEFEYLDANGNRMRKIVRLGVVK